MESVIDNLSSIGAREITTTAFIIGLAALLAASKATTKATNTLKLILYKVYFVNAKPGNSIVFTLLRKFAPYFTFEFGGKRITLITRASDMREILQQHDVFGQGNRYGMDPAFAPGFFMMARDKEPVHEHEKSIMRSILIREDLPRVRKMAGDLARQNIKEAIAKGDGTLDAIATLSKLVPTQIVDQYFGFTPPSYEAMMNWSDALQGGFFYNGTKDEKIQQTCTDACMEAREYIREHLLPKKRSELKKNPSASDDPVSRMLRTAFVEEANFDIERVVSNTVGLLVGCVETNNNAIIKTLDRLMAMPEAMALAREAAKAGDDDKLIKICWEALRWNAPTRYLPRIVEEDTVFRDSKEFKKGDIVLCSHRAAFFDPDFVHKPNKFTIDRPDHIISFHFGSGKHICLGEYVSAELAPMVIKEILLYKPVVKRVNGKVGELETRPGTPFLQNFLIEFAD